MLAQYPGNNRSRQTEELPSLTLVNPYVRGQSRNDRLYIRRAAKHLPKDLCPRVLHILLTLSGESPREICQVNAARGATGRGLSNCVKKTLCAAGFLSFFHEQPENRGYDSG